MSSAPVEENDVEFDMTSGESMQAMYAFRGLAHLNVRQTHGDTRWH